MINKKCDNTGSTKTILFVSGFVVDTYSEIEASFVELCARPNSEIQYIWLVPEITAKDNQFTNLDNRKLLSEPVWVHHLRENGIPYIVGNIQKYNLIANLLLFHKLFKAQKIDAVFTHFGMERYWATLCGKLWGKITIWNEHWHSLGTRHIEFKRLFYWMFIDEFIAVSKFIRNTLPRKSSVHTILNAIQPATVTLADNEKITWRKRLKIKAADTNKVILMVAAFRTEKRHIEALEICRNVLNKKEDVIFIFLGEGPLRRKFLVKAKEMKLDHKIMAPGHVDNVEDYYMAADVCMLTSYYEPFGYCVLEAMKYALPIVAFENGGPAEVIRHGETGVLIKEGDLDGFANWLIELVRKDSLRARIGERAERAVREEFSRGIWIRDLTDVLRKIVNGKPNKLSSRVKGEGNSV